MWRPTPAPKELLQGIIGRLSSGDVALVQAVPSMQIGDLATELMEAMAPTRLYIDLSAIEDNVATFRRVGGGRRAASWEWSRRWPTAPIRWP